MTAVHSTVLLLALVHGTTTRVEADGAPGKSRVREVYIDGAAAISTVELTVELSPATAPPRAVVRLHPGVSGFLEEMRLHDAWRTIQALIAASFGAHVELDVELRRDPEAPESRSLHVIVATTLEVDSAWAAYRAFTRARVESVPDSTRQLFTVACEFP